MNSWTVFQAYLVRAFSLMIVLVLIANSNSALAQPSLNTSNRFVEGDVEYGTGLVTWYDLDRGRRELSFPRESFLTVGITLNGSTKYYTNSHQSPGQNGVVTGFLYDGATSKIGDTVRTIWNVNSVDIIQDVYPFAFETSGQIVLKVRVKNHSSTAVTVQEQYLLDIDIDNNDRAKILTRWGYSPNWNQYPNAQISTLPPFYLAFKSPLPAQSLAGTGYLDNTLEQLIVPNQFTIGDWTQLVNYTWGVPYGNYAGTPYGDNALLMQWNPQTVGNDSTAAPTEIGRTSYGTGEFQICYSNIVAILFFPQRIRYDRITRKYANNPFTVEALLFNTHDPESASNVVGTLSVDNGMRIIAPQPLAIDSLSQAHAPAPNSIAALDVADIQWTVSAPLVTNCHDDSISNISLRVTAAGNYPPLLGCKWPITLECTERDTVPPKYTKTVGGSKSDSSFTTFDSTVQDAGMKSVTYVQASGLASNFVVTINNGVLIANCPKSIIPVSITRKDTTIGGCLDFTFTDCAGNSSYKEVCFKAYPVTPSKDTIKPTLTLINVSHWPTVLGVLDSGRSCTAQHDSLLATDERPNDVGIRSITAISAVNMTLNVPNFVNRAPRVRFSVSVIDTFKDGSIKVRAMDDSGLYADTTINYCHIPDTLRPFLSVGPYINGTWHVIASDERNWDTGIDSILLSNLVNVKPIPDPAIVSQTVPRLHHFEFDMVSQDTFNRAGFCIIAKDVAGNRDKDFGTCVSISTPEDIWKPNLTITPVATDPRSINVAIDDIHFSSSKQEINYDTGIDSVWLTNVTNIKVSVGGSPFRLVPPTLIISNPYTAGKLPYFPKTVPTLTFSVADTNSTDTLACLTINVVDGRQHQDASAANITSATWCYPVSQDYLAPVITGTGSTNTSVLFVVTDSAKNDRGLGNIQLIGPINFQPLSKSYSGDKSVPLTLNVINAGKSATGLLQVTDLYGLSLSDTLRTRHTGQVFAAIYAQNMKMHAARLIVPPVDFNVPVLLDSTDDIPLAQKALSAYNFTFSLKGSPLISFLQPITAGTESAGWIVTPMAGTNNSWMIDAKAPAGQILSTMKDTVLFLRFRGQASDTSGSTTISISSPISYNGGNSYKVSGTNGSTLILPAPYGDITAGNIVIKGACSPLVNSSASTPNAISLAPASPNPLVRSTRIEYTIPLEGTVLLDLFDALGTKVKSLISESERPGTYQFDLRATDLATGTYFLRLESGGKVCTRGILISR